MSEPTNSETCGRCGFPASEHHRVTTMGASHVLMCPTATFLEDQLPAMFDSEHLPEKGKPS